MTVLLADYWRIINHSLDDNQPDFGRILASRRTCANKLAWPVASRWV
jgi:hypothetical protein